MAFRVEITANAQLEADEFLGWLVVQHAGETGVRWFHALHSDRLTERLSAALPDSIREQSAFQRDAPFALWPKAPRIPDLVHH